MQNRLISNQWEKLESIRFWKLNYRSGDQIIQTFCKIGSALEIRSPFFNLLNFWDCGKSMPESCTVDWNLMNDKEFESVKLLKLKYSWVDQIIQTFCKFSSPQKLGPPSLISRNLKTLRKLLLNHAQCIEM